MRQFVRIENRNSYTSVRKAADYIRRGLATTIDGDPLRINMLDAAALLTLRSAMRADKRDYDPVTGAFAWYVGDSGGSQMMRDYQGVSGGTRVYQANHKDGEKDACGNP